MAEHVMENAYLRVTVADHGAELISVYDKEREQERIWCGDPAVWNRHAPVLFPFVGKANGGCYRHQGQVYEMKTQHGFARDREFVCVKAGEDKIIHRLTSDEETLAIYPFPFTLYITHRFSPENPRELEVSWEVINDGEQKMYYSIGGHPGFAVPPRPAEQLGAGDQKEDGNRREDYFLEFPGKERVSYILLNQENGLAVPEQKEDLVLNDGFYPIEKHLFDRDALVFEDGQIAAVRIAGPDRQPFVTLSCEGFPYVGIWSKPDGPFVCLEPWVGRTDDDGFSGELAEKTGEVSLEAKENRMYTYRIEFHR